MRQVKIPDRIFSLLVLTEENESNTCKDAVNSVSEHMYQFIAQKIMEITIKCNDVFELTKKSGISSERLEKEILKFKI